MVTSRGCAIPMLMVGFKDIGLTEAGCKTVGETEFCLCEGDLCNGPTNLQIPQKPESLESRQTDCTPKKSVAQCERCINGDQCIEGFCCPYMKLCIPSSTT